MFGRLSLYTDKTRPFPTTPPLFRIGNLNLPVLGQFERRKPTAPLCDSANSNVLAPYGNMY